MQQTQLDQTLARPKGWDAFYSFSAPKVHGYSGTVTFVRQKSRPIDAMQGFSSLCCVSEIPTLLERLALYGAGASSTCTKSETVRGGMSPEKTSSPRKRPAQDQGPEDEQTAASEEWGVHDDFSRVNDVEGGGLLQLLCETSPEHLRALDSEVGAVLHLARVFPASESCQPSKSRFFAPALVCVDF